MHWVCESTLIFQTQILTRCPIYRVLKTPQVLELSGFGKKEVLDKIGVPVKVNIPGVGENVQDHIFVGMSWGKRLFELRF